MQDEINLLSTKARKSWKMENVLNNLNQKNFEYPFGVKTPKCNSQPKCRPVTGRRLDLNTSAPEQQCQETEVPTGGSGPVQITPEPPDGKRNETPLSPFVQSDDSAWNQSQLAKVLLTLKDSDFKTLTFTDKSYKPFEYEKWKMAMDRTFKGLHPEIGKYWEKITKTPRKSTFNT